MNANARWGAIVGSLGTHITMTPENHRRRAGDDIDCDCDNLAGKVGDDTCDKVLVEVCRANKLGVTITIWDLPQVTGLPLHEAFAAVRALEFGRILSIGDDPANPFGATLHIQDAAMTRLDKLRAA